MREIIEEYTGIVAGGLTTIAILSLTIEFILGREGLYRIVLQFSQSIC